MSQQAWVLGTSSWGSRERGRPYVDEEKISNQIDLIKRKSSSFMKTMRLLGDSNNYIRVPTV